MNICSATTTALHPDAILAMYAKLFLELGQDPDLLKGHQVETSTSIGIALSAPEYRHEEEILYAAGLAMYTAKQDKALPFCVFRGPVHCDRPPADVSLREPT